MIAAAWQSGDFPEITTDADWVSFCQYCQRTGDDHAKRMLEAWQAEPQPEPQTEEQQNQQAAKSK